MGYAVGYYQIFWVTRYPRLFKTITKRGKLAPSELLSLSVSVNKVNIIFIIFKYHLKNMRGPCGLEVGKVFGEKGRWDILVFRALGSFLFNFIQWKGLNAKKSSWNKAESSPLSSWWLHKIGGTPFKAKYHISCKSHSFSSVFSESGQKLHFPPARYIITLNKFPYYRQENEN